jgi:hypothetical protein
MALVTSVEQPYELRPVGAVIHDPLVADHEQIAFEQRQHRMGESVQRGRVAPLRDEDRPRGIADVEDDGSAVEITQVTRSGRSG